MVPDRVRPMAKANDKLIEATMALLQAAPDMRLNAVVLNKALFYLDLLALHELGQPVTGQKFIAMPQGPYVDKFQKRVVRALEENGWADQVEDEKAKPVVVRQPMAAFRSLSEREVELAKKVAEKIAPLTSKRASDFSHDNLAWKIAYAEGLATGKGAKAIDMRIAMQQVGEADPWLVEDADPALEAEFEAAHLATSEWTE